MVQKIKYIVRLLRYLLKAKHRKGYGVHSPFSFDLITNIFEEKNQYYIYDKIEQLREELLADKRVIDVLDYGTGKSGLRKISTIASLAVKKSKYAQLLFRLVNAFKSNTIIELGTSFGLTTAYLASANSNALVYTLEGCPMIASIAKAVHEKCGLKNITVCVGNIDENLPDILHKFRYIDFVFFDANHTKEATLKYFYLCLNKIHSESVFVLDDIHYSNEMEEAWREIKENSKVSVSFDLFSLGIVFFNTQLKKQDYILYF